MALSKLTDIRKSLSVEIEDLQVNGITTFTGNVSVGGTLTYQDVTNIDSVGLITARSGIHVSGGNVKIGTTTAGYSTADDLTIATSGSTGITLRSGTSSEGTLYFADGTGSTAQYSGIIAYNHGDNSMRFATNDGTEKLRIKSTGYVGIGTVDPQALLHVYDDAAAVYNKIESTHSAAALELRQVNRYGTLNYYYQGTHKWIIGQVNQEDDISIFQPTGVAAGENSYRVVVKASGNIGIHSSSPTTTLDVAGTTKTKQLNVTGVSTFNDDVTFIDGYGNSNHVVYDKSQTALVFPSGPTSGTNFPAIIIGDRTSGGNTKLYSDYWNTHLKHIGAGGLVISFNY